MRIKRTDKNFTVRQKAGRKIHYAGQGKKYTGNTASFSPKEKQDALRQKDLSGAGIGIQSKRQIQRQSNAGRDADDTAKSCQQEHGNSAGGRDGSKCGDLDVFGNLHVKRPLQKYRKESVMNQEQPAGNRQPEQQQVQRPSAYHENTIKTKGPALHRKEDTPSSIKRADGFILKERKRKKEKAQKLKTAIKSKAHKEKYAGEARREKSSGNFSTDDNAGNLSASGYAQSFSDRRDGQISRYKRNKFFKPGKEKYSRIKAGRENTGIEADTAKSAGTPKIPEAYQMKVQAIQMQGTGEPALLQVQDNNIPINNTSTSHIQKRNAGDSIRQRGGDISGRKDGVGRKDKKNKKDKGKDKDAKKDKSRSNSKKRKDRAAAFRLLSYVSDKFSQEEQKDSLLKVAKDLLAGKAKAAAAGKLLSIGASLLPALISVFIVTVIITLLFNSPFSILLPKLSEEPGVVEVLAEYTEEFREKVQEELADPGSGDETELIYEDYEGDGEPDNMADILMVYMVKHGFGDTATVMTEKNRRALKAVFDEMTSMSTSYRREVVEQSYEEEDFYGNVTIRTEEVEIKIKEVRITLLTSEDIIRTGIFTEEETEILRYLMSPEVLENIEGLTDGYGSPSAGSLTPEEAERLNLGGDVGSQAVKNALARLGKPYSQAKRDSGDYYDCSSLTYYAYKEAGINLSYHGSNTAASQGQLLSDRGCEVDYEDIQPGDLIFYSFTRNGRYKNISHVAVYAGNGYLVDASSSKGYVVFRPVYSTGKIVMCGRPSWL
ncbi:C40 family peptidase [Parablautia intestinalis]|uniref:C40 family peptidase n=1 Tax=Parablautia intestinalis TaxID=2320100 RepID=UPI00256EDF3D|nr:C40 family peptidase [Parablautia intestinalis]